MAIRGGAKYWGGPWPPETGPRHTLPSSPARQPASSKPRFLGSGGTMDAKLKLPPVRVCHTKVCPAPPSTLSSLAANLHPLPLPNLLPPPLFPRSLYTFTYVCSSLPHTQMYFRPVLWFRFAIRIDFQCITQSDDYMHPPWSCLLKHANSVIYIV